MTSARVPISLPVPAVVDIWASAIVRPVIFSRPIISLRLCLPDTSIETSLAISIALPPPKPMIKSGSCALAAAIAASRFGISGSGTTFPKIDRLCRGPKTERRSALKASATTNGRRYPRAFTQSARSAMVPEPKRMTGGLSSSIGFDISNMRLFLMPHCSQQVFQRIRSLQ